MPRARARGEYRVETVLLGPAQVVRLAGQHGGARGDQDEDAHCGKRQRHVEDPAEPLGQVQLETHQRDQQAHADDEDPCASREHGGALVLVGVPDEGAVVERQVVRLGQQVQLHQVGRLPVEVDDLRGRRPGRAVRLPVEQQGLTGEAVVAAERVEQVAGGVLLGALVGELGRLEQRVARLLPVVVVAFQRLLAHAAPGRASREQRVGELRVHVGERKYRSPVATTWGPAS